MNLKTKIVTFFAVMCALQVPAQEVKVGALYTDQYLPLLEGKQVAFFSNNTAVAEGKHTLDRLLENGVNVTTIFSPEHGFRGTADAGERVGSSVDPETGIKIASLYDGNTRIPSKEVMDSVDVIVVDIQDVGLRFYTYYGTMLDLMNAAVIYDKPFIILDRPNPNGMYVDGPILDMKFKSGVGHLPIPTVYGMTLGELAQMVNGEGWLDNGAKVDLTVIKCGNYTHQTRYELPVIPSPNLRTMKAVYLYPSMCYFEATPVSLGRGTEAPFEIYGHPDMTGYDFNFTPVSMFGAKTPPQMDKLCHGRDLRDLDDEEIIANGINLEYLIDAYNNLNIGDDFFYKSFERLMGVEYIRPMIQEGKTAQEIKATWQSDVERFKEQRRPYLLYEE